MQNFGEIYTERTKHQTLHGCLQEFSPIFFFLRIFKNFQEFFLFKNFRPVSNLSFVSKLTESAVYNQTHSHICMNNLYPANQSSYRKNYSTETALLRVKNDILLNMNKQHVTLLVLLDLSAAFDTVDHNVLLSRLHSKFGISGTALEWFRSYLNGRS